MAIPSSSTLEFSPTRVHHHDYTETLCTELIASSLNDEDGEEEFEFDFSGQLEKVSLSADELFDGGKIKPLKPQTPRFHCHQEPSSTETQNSSAAVNHRKQFPPELQKTTKSLSQFRVSNVLSDTEPETAPATETITRTSSLASFWSKKWKIKDLLLFRSASESHANVTVKKNEVKCSSFRSLESSGNGSISRRRLSAHELHYTVNRAASKEKKKRTFLPYKQGLLSSCLGFFPSEISKSLSSTISLSRAC